jgi:MSHA biogenesis protein MshQ
VRRASGVIALLASACGRVAFDPLTATDGNTDGDGPAASGWLDAAWSYRKRITVAASAVVEDLTQFPLSIVLDNDAAIFAHARSDGHDLRFTLGDGRTTVPFDVELFDPAAGYLDAWVTPAMVSATSDTTLYVYYGNLSAAAAEDEAGTYGNAFRAVWHMSEVPAVAATLLDTTPSNHAGTFNGGMTATASVAGTSGHALDFDGVDDYISVPDAPSLRFADEPFSIDAWVFMRDASAFKIYAKGVTRPGIEYYFRTGGEADDDLIIRSYDAQGDYIGRLYSAGMTPYENQWVHVAATYDGSATNAGFALYVNGNRVDDQDGALNVYDGALASTSAVDIGRYLAGGFADGMIDELRVSAVVRTPGWLLTSFRNWDSRDTFYAVGAEETQ